MNEAERRLRFVDTYVAVGMAILVAVQPDEALDDDNVELYIARLMREVDQFWRVYRDYEGRQI